MAENFEYQHKKFHPKPVEDFVHKKFDSNKNKRIREDTEDKENIITAQSILEKALKDAQTEQPLAKRRQIKPLFRPWEDAVECKSTTKMDISTTEPLKATPAVLSSISTNIKETKQPKWNQSTLAYINARRRQHYEQMMLQQYAAKQYMWQQAAMMEHNMRASLHLRHLQQIAMQRRQQQLFVFGQHY